MTHGKARIATRGAIGRLRHHARRLRRGRAGVAAVEFALILPLMLVLYFGCVLLAQGLEVARKTQSLSHTLADLTSRQLAGTEISGNCASYSSVPCLLDSDIQGIFNASTAVLYPFTGSPNMTITQVIFDNVSNTNTECCVAKVMWSVGLGPSPTLRQCGTLSASLNGVNSSTTVPMGVYPGTYPNGGGDAVTNPTGYSASPLVTSNNTTDYYLIIADVNYTYTPNFGFAPFAWNKTPNTTSSNTTGGYTISQTTYMTPRNGANSSIQWTPGNTFNASCAANTPCYISCTSGSTPYNTP